MALVEADVAARVGLEDAAVPAAVAEREIVAQ
jgi:hypothetical protein